MLTVQLGCAASVVFLNCSNPVIDDPQYVQVNSGGCDSGGHIYAILGRCREHIQEFTLADIKVGCRSKVATLANLEEHDTDDRNMSYAYIHKLLEEGFWLSWLPLICKHRCGNNRRGTYCSINETTQQFQCQQHGYCQLLEHDSTNCGTLARILGDILHIKKMTRGFKEKLGQGGFGCVYKGKLRSGLNVAIKMLNKSKGNGQEFVNEVSTIARIHHVNMLYPVKDRSVVLTAARGTLGYMAPELFYQNIGGVSYKVDVYSFGMLLMEMGSRRRNSSPHVRHSSQHYFPFWIYDQFKEENDIDMQDASQEDKILVKKRFIIALWCIQLKPNDRPSMKNVVKMLEGKVENLEMPAKPSYYPYETIEHDDRIKSTESDPISKI
ncbi:hypothetical protein VNO78_30711 [Psophocarpus tetragonolobus]|uniref:Protein kinase domain-containing protein n=1 Tax=Psophocarpus tetragonolobus TaxID=3891 RepID=A0AAN9X7W0_PSOTE